MTQKKPTPSAPVLPVLIAVVLLAVFGAVFFIGFLNLSTVPPADIPEELTADTYMDIVTVLLADADPARGEDALRRHGCLSCHAGAAVANNLAPGFEGIATRAETIRPPLTAAAYLYEAIVYPTAFDAGGFSAMMPQNYGSLPEQDLGDMIAYLLTLTAD